MRALSNVLVAMYQTSHSKGQELVAQRMVKWLNRVGLRAWLVTSCYHDGERVTDLAGEDYLMFSEDPLVKVPSIRVDGYKASWPPRRIMFRDFLGVLEKLSKEIGVDALITHSTLWNGPEDAAKWATWKKVYSVFGEPGSAPVFAHMSHYQPPDPRRYTEYERSYRIAWNQVVLQQVLRAADLVLCVTPLEAEDMVKLGASPGKIHIYPGGLDDEEAALIDQAEPDLIIEKYKLPRDKRIVAYLGTIEYRKNPLAVVKVAARLRHRDDAVFVIAGRPGDQYEDVVRAARRLPNVYILGELTVEEKASLIKASYINIIMSRMEALGLTQVEFMYGGVPVVTSAVYGQRWLVRDGVDGIHVDGPEDIDGAAEAVARLLDDEALRDWMARNARSRAERFLMSFLARELRDRMKAVYEHHLAHAEQPHYGEKKLKEE